REMRQVTEVALIAYPNAGLPVTTGGRTTYGLGPEEMAKDYPALVDAGCNIVGGRGGLPARHPRARRPRRPAARYRPGRRAAVPWLPEGGRSAERRAGRHLP